MDLILFLMEISMVIYFYQAIFPYNNQSFQEIKAIVKKQKIKWLITKPTTMNDDINEGGGGGRKGRWGGREAWREQEEEQDKDKKEKKKGELSSIFVAENKGSFIQFNVSFKSLVSSCNIRLNK